MAEEIGTLVARVVADTEGFRSEMLKLSRQMNTNTASMNRSLSGIDKGLGTLTTGFRTVTRVAAAFGVALSVRALVSFTRASIDAADELFSMSKRLGVSVAALSELQYAAKLSNVEFSTLTQSMQFMTRAINEAATGTGRAGAGLRALGLSAKTLKDLPLDKQLELVLDRLDGVDNASKRVAISMQIFGRSGAVMLQLAGDVGRLRAEAAQLGITLSDEFAARADMANDAMDRLAFISKAAFRDAALAVAPLIVALTEVKGEFGGFGPTFDRFVDGVAVGIGMLEDAFWGWRIIILQLRETVLDVMSFQLGLLGKIVRGAEAARDALANIALDAIKVHEFLDVFGVGDLLGRGKAKAFLEGIVGDRSASDWINNLADSLKQTAIDAQRTKEQLAASVRPSEQLAANLQQARLDAAEAARERAAELGGGEKPLPMPWEGKEFGRIGEVSDRYPGAASLDKYRETVAENEALITQIMVDEFAKRRAAEERYLTERAQREQEVANLTIAFRESMTDSVIGLLRTLGAEHRGAAIAAIAIEKWRAIQTTLMQGQSAAASILASSSAAGWKAMWELGPIAGPPVAAAIWTKGKIDAARVKAMSIASAVVSGIEGAVQASQLSSGGTQTTRGTTANPLVTSVGSTLSGSAAAANRKQSVVTVQFMGPIYGWDDYIRNKVIDSIREAVDGKDVVIIGPTSLQAQLIGGG